MSNLAVIPARGGSKRLLRKNIREFGGKPMIAWTIIAAQNAGMFGRVIVSTDDWEIAGIAEHYGAEVPFIREDVLAGDNVPISLVTLDAVVKVEGFERVCQLMPNCPLRDFDDIRDSFTSFVSSEADSQLSVTDYGWTSPWWAINGEGRRIFDRLDTFNKRSQDLPELYCPTGAVWWADVEALKRYKTFYTPSCALWHIDRLHGIDIDTEKDLEVAEALRRIA